MLRSIALSGFVVLALGSVAVSAQTTASATGTIGTGGQGDANCSTCKNYKSPKIYLAQSERNISFDLKFFEVAQSKEAGSPKSWKADVSLYSYAKEFKFLTSKNAANASSDNDLLRIVADDFEIKPKSILYFYLRENVRTDGRVSFKSFKPQIKDGKVYDETGAEVTGTLGENINVTLGSEELQRILAAKTIELKMGSEKFPLTEAQITQLKDAAKNTGLPVK